MGSYLSTEQPEEVENQVSSDFSRMSMQPQSLQPNKLRKPSVTILNEILREKVKLNDDLVTENNEILREFLFTFIPKMKNDKTFAALYQDIYFTGSYYSDLRVSTPDEFDLNIRLKLPFKSNCVAVQYNSQVPSYLKYGVTDENAILRDNGVHKLFVNGYLDPNKVRTWLQSVVDRALQGYRPPRRVNQVKSKAAGPARTIILVKQHGVIDIDLVPAIECSLGIKPPGIDGRVYEKVKNKLQCFLIPKPYQPTKQAPVNELERSRLWRAHYPEAESSVIHDLGCTKPVIKLMKLLRDKENWKILASYYLKTIVLWMVLCNPSAEYWKSDKIGERFLDALRQLACNVQQRKICYFFSSKYNLLEKLTEAQAINIYHRLCAIIKSIEKDPNNLWEIFSCRPTFAV